MTTIESKTVQVKAPTEVVFAFLGNTDNLFHLLPQNKISDWKSTGTECTFKVQGTYTIGLKLKESHSPEKHVFENTPGSPFPFTLDVTLKTNPEGCEASQVCHAQINPFLEMMVKGPLKNLFDYMADKLAERFADSK